MPLRDTNDGPSPHANRNQGELDRIIQRTLREVAHCSEGGLRLVRVLALFDHIIRHNTGVHEVKVPIGNLVEEQKHLFSADDVRDIFFAIGIRNRVAHVRSDSQPSDAELDRATNHLVRAIGIVHPTTALNEYRINQTRIRRPLVPLTEPGLRHAAAVTATGSPYSQLVAGINDLGKFVLYTIACVIVTMWLINRFNAVNAPVRPVPAKQSREPEPFMATPDADGNPAGIGLPRPKNWWDGYAPQPGLGGPGVP